MTAALLQRAHALAGAGRPEAIAAYRTVLAHRPDCADAANNLGVLLRARGEDAAAIGHYRQALAADPAHGDAAYNLGRALLDTGAPAQAVPYLRHAVARQPQAERLHTLGRALQASDALAAAASAYRAALRLDPDGVATPNNLANALLGLGRPDHAVALLDRALAVHPGHAELRYNRALALLTLGRMAEGYADYEARWRARGFPSPMRDFALPRWNGAAATNATLLLHWEQGLGDTIQFARYVAAARQRVGRVVLLVQPALQRLLLGTADAVLAEGERLPAADLQLPLLSLPHVLDMPSPPPARLRVSALPPRPNRGARQVGVVWAGNPGHGNDRNRSLPPGVLAPLMRVPGIALHNLQLGPRRGELPASAFAPRDLADTAARVAGLDLVIAVDTAVAHLAGALGVPVWLLVPFAPDWRWGNAGRKTQWYPSMRLFRQRVAGCWDTPLGEIIAGLQLGAA